MPKTTSLKVNEIYQESPLKNFSNSKKETILIQEPVLVNNFFHLQTNDLATSNQSPFMNVQKVFVDAEAKPFDKNATPSVTAQQDQN